MSHPDLGRLAWRSAWPPDAELFPDAYESVLWRRALAFCLDAAILGAVLGGLDLVRPMTPPSSELIWDFETLALPAVVVLAYHSLQIASAKAATLGMLAFNLRVHATAGGRPTPSQAILRTVGFYATLGFTGGLLLLTPLFNNQRRSLHDFVAGTIVLRNVVG